MQVGDGGAPRDGYDCFVVGSGPARCEPGARAGRGQEAGAHLRIRRRADASAASWPTPSATATTPAPTGTRTGSARRAARPTSGPDGRRPPRPIDLRQPGRRRPLAVARSELLTYWKRAAPILNHDPAYVDFEAPLTPGFLYRPVPTPPPKNFGSYSATLKASPYVDIALGYSLVGPRCQSLAVHGHAPRVLWTIVLNTRGQFATSPSQAVVLAAGGMGNAQLLMLPQGRRQRAGRATRAGRSAST